jgi:sugar/nucleoside kinase (ribokinase family)
VATPEFVVVGHVVKDLAQRGYRLGGTATFAAVQAERLGLRAGIVTRTSSDLALDGLLRGVEIASAPSEKTTTFQNVYHDSVRKQRVSAQAAALSPNDVPKAWRRASIALIGPVCGEVPPEMAGVFASKLIGVSAQGWLRRVDRSEHVRRCTWKGAPFWRGAHTLFVSDEDLGSRRDQIDRWIKDVPVVAVTSNRRGARVHEKGRWQKIGAFPAKEIDPTGAGDVFATAFLVELRKTNDVAQATRFASAAAACAIEAPGVKSIGTRAQIEKRMNAHPEIELR